MTKEERNNKLKYLITCMKCEVDGKCCDENCPTQYNAGNMGEIIKNLEEISKILEQESCEDAISREAMLNYQRYLHGRMSNEENHKLWEFIKDLPPVTPAPKKCHNENHDYAECDQFVCPNCGAKVDERKSE